MSKLGALPKLTPLLSSRPDSHSTTEVLLTLRVRPFEHICFYCLERDSVIREALRAEMRFQFVEQRIAFGLRGTFERYTLLVVRRVCWRRAKIGTAHSAQARQYLPYQLIGHQS